MRNELDRRWKACFISPNTILGLFQDWKSIKIGTAFSQVLFKNLPRDIHVDHVWWDNLRQAFGFLIYHESFDIIPFANDPPIVDGEHFAFFLPCCNSLEEARKLGVLASRSEEELLAALLSEIKL